MVELLKVVIKKKSEHLNTTYGLSQTIVSNHVIFRDQDLLTSNGMFFKS